MLDQVVEAFCLRVPVVIEKTQDYSGLFFDRACPEGGTRKPNSCLPIIVCALGATTVAIRQILQEAFWLAHFSTEKS